MGQDESRIVDESTPPDTLKARTVEAVAKYIESGKVRRVVVMNGAGISTSAGIPDFRSPDTGLYANLQRLNLPYAEAVFDINYFRQNPHPFYTLAHELYPGKFRPTIAHSFIRLLYDKHLLSMVFTQNIDCLEHEAGVPDDKIVEAHGSFARQRCIECRVLFPNEAMRTAISAKEVPYCREPDCNGLVKPDIVFFGEALPEAFFRNRHMPSEADLCIIMGTSLTVQPFASLPQLARESVPRVLINQERVGGLGSRPDDVLMLGDCDAGVRQLADALGWRDELEALWAATQPASATAVEAAAPPKTKDEQLNEEITKLTAEMDKSLRLMKEHTEWVKDSLDAEAASRAKIVLERDAAKGDPNALEQAHEVQNTSPVVEAGSGVDPIAPQSKDAIEAAGKLEHPSQDSEPGKSSDNGGTGHEHKAVSGNEKL